jgi:flagellar basal-body rod protein FlgF
MGGLFEIGGVVLAASQRQADIASQNIANMTTAGYKSRHRFAELLSADGASAPRRPQGNTAVDFSQGKLMTTANPLDLAIEGRGFFVVQQGSATLYTRDGAFHRDAQGRLATDSGAIVQLQSGDYGTGTVSIQPDGTILQSNEPVGKLAVADFADPSVLSPVGTGLFAAPPGRATDLGSPKIRQGMLEASNVSTAEEMISLMASLRSAETGQRIVQVQDDLLDRAITAFGQS